MCVRERERETHHVNKKGWSSLLTRFKIMLLLVTTSSFGPGNWSLIRITFQKQPKKIKTFLETPEHPHQSTLLSTFQKTTSYYTNLLGNSKNITSAISNSPSVIQVRVFSINHGHTQNRQNSKNQMEHDCFPHFLFLPRMPLNIKKPRIVS